MIDKKYKKRNYKFAFSLIESIVVLSLIAILTAGTLSVMNRKNNSDSISARSALVHLLTLQSSQSDAPIYDIDILGNLDPKRSYTTSNSDSVNIISVMISPDDPGLLAAAVFDGDGCWMLLRDYTAASTNELEIWAVETESSVCSAQRALSIVVPDPAGTLGKSGRKPIII
jgi:hypothetical protein